MTARLGVEEITGGNLEAAIGIHVRPEQEHFAAPVAVDQVVGELRVG